MRLDRAIPHVRLRGVLRAFEERRAELGGASLAWPVAARPHQVLILHLGEPYEVRLDGGGAARMPRAALVGPQSYQRAYVRLTGSVHVFTILFQPTGLNRLFGIDMTSLLNQDPDAADVLGGSAATLVEAVQKAPSFDLRVAAVERWVEGLLETGRPDCQIDSLARHVISARGGLRIRDLTAASGLGSRQFRRRFALQVGMAPKLFARTVRFDRALAARRAGSNRSWTDILHDLGYFDQAHFIKECHAFAGRAPGGLVGDWDNMFFPGE